MAIEIEKKYRLDETRKRLVLDALEELNAEYKGEDFEENTIYGGGILDAERAVLRVRRTESKTVLTYKKRIQNDFAVKQQIEHETEISNAGEAEKIIASLGFEPRIVYEKRRKTWKFRQVEIVVDELPFGDFMEIEGSITAIAEAEMFLDAENFEIEHETYPRLTAKLGSRAGGVFQARF